MNTTKYIMKAKMDRLVEYKGRVIWNANKGSFHVLFGAFHITSRITQMNLINVFLGIWKSISLVSLIRWDRKSTCYDSSRSIRITETWSYRRIRLSSSTRDHLKYSKYNFNLKVIPSNYYLKCQKAYVIGSPKCGGQQLRNYLKYHPQIFFAERNQVSFWDKFQSNGLQWYKEQFPKTKSWQIGTDYTTDYFMGKNN